MAIIKTVKEIQHLMPKPNCLAFMSMTTTTPEAILLTDNTCAIEVDENKCKVTNIYKVGFTLFNSPGRTFLFICDASKFRDINYEGITATTPYVKGEMEKSNEQTEFVTLDKITWDFKIDEIGLYAEVGVLNKKRIYFATSRLDAKEIKKSIIKREEKKILKLEPIYA